jgi:hypothetical protein
MRKIALFLLMLALASCDAYSTLTSGLEQSEAVAVDIEKSTKLKPFVGFSWNNGSLTSVNVNFPEIPQGKSTQEIASAVTTAIKKQFKQSPKQVILSFTIKAAE